MARRFALEWSVAAAISLVVTAAGCATPFSPVDLGGGGHTDLAVPSDPVEAGALYVTERGCPTCHDPGDGSLSGQAMPLTGTMAYGANLTPDTDTGIGGWTDDNFKSAITTGIDDQGVPLCPPMPHFTDMGETELAAITAYLRSLKAVSHAVPDSVCPPLKGGVADLPDAGEGDLSTGPELSDLAIAGGADLVASASDMAAQGGCHGLINELQIAGNGGATDEFIELLNPCGAAIDFTGAKLVYLAAAGTKETVLLQFTGQLPAMSRFVCGGSGFTGNAGATYTATSLAAKGGGVGLRDANGNLLDSVGYGDATNAFVRVAAAAAPASAQSIERLPDGHDTGDNATDFAVAKTPTPGKTNK